MIDLVIIHASNLGGSAQVGNSVAVPVPGTGQDPVDVVEEGNMRPVTSNAVYMLAGNIEAVIGTI